MPMVVETKNDGTSITKSEIAHFEQEIGYELPLDYRAFLLQTNGGYPNRLLTIDTQKGRKLRLWHFHNVSAPSQEERLRLEETPVFDGAAYLIFATDKSRYPLLMGLSGDNTGKIFYLNLITASEDQRLEKDLELLADSFSDLTDKLYEALDHRAARIIENDVVEELDSLLNELPEGYTNGIGRTLMAEAAFCGSIKVIMALIEKDHDIEEAIEHGQMSLPPDVIKALLRKRSQDKMGDTTVKEHDLCRLDNVQTSAHQAFKRIGVALTVPAGFLDADDESFINDQARARIDVFTHDAPLEVCMQNCSEVQWLYNQHVLTESMPVELNGNKGMYFVVVPVEDRFAIQFLLFEHDGKTIQLSASYPKDHEEMKAALRQSLLSAVTYNFDPEVLLSFSVDSKNTALQVATIKPDALFLSTDGVWPTRHPDQAVFIAIADKGIVPKNQYRDYMTVFFGQSAQQSEQEDEFPVIDSMLDVVIDGLDAIVATGQTSRAHLFAAVIFGHGHIYRFWASTIPDKIAQYRPQFDQLVQSFKRKAEALAFENDHQKALEQLINLLKPMIQRQAMLSFVPDEKMPPATSHLFGKPVMPATGSIPTIQHIQKPMGLLLQLLSTDIPDLPVSRLQIFANPSRFRDATDIGHDIQVVVGIDEKADQWQVVEDGWTQSAMMLHQPVNCRVIVSEGKSLPDWLSVQTAYPEIVAICRKGSLDMPELLYQTALGALGVSSANHMIGGDCPAGITPPIGSDGRPMKFTGKISTEASYGLVWRHGGSLLLFYEEHDLTKWRYLIQAGLM